MTVRGSLLSFRIQRFETTIVVGAAVLSVLVSALVILLVNTRYSACLTNVDLNQTAFCQTGLFPWLGRIARLSVSIVPVFPVVAGLLAGGPIVARELESGTARLAWSIGPSRLRWLAQRAIPIFLMVAAAAIAVGFTAEALVHLLTPSLDLDRSFEGFRNRGLLVGVQAVLVASIALAVGALLGRSVPTFVLTLVLVGGLGIAVDKVERSILTNEAAIADAQTFSFDTNLVLEDRLRLPDGSVLTWDEAMATHPGAPERLGRVERHPRRRALHSGRALPRRRAARGAGAARDLAWLRNARDVRRAEAPPALIIAP
jgi:hypothetical protein